jgi:hypothetical protein
MEYAINLLNNEIKDLERQITDVIEVRYRTNRRGAAPAGASWDVSEEDEMKRLDGLQKGYESAIEQCEEALEWIANV